MAGGATSWAGELRSFYLRHPWVLQVSYARPVLGPHEQAVMETLAGIASDGGCPRRPCAASCPRCSTSYAATPRRPPSHGSPRPRPACPTRSGGRPVRRCWSDLAPDFAERFPMSIRLSTPEPVPARRDESTPQGNARPTRPRRIWNTRPTRPSPSGWPSSSKESTRPGTTCSSRPPSLVIRRTGPREPNDRQRESPALRRLRIRSDPPPSRDDRQARPGRR